MRIYLIGHRGVGKSTLLQRINKYFPEDLCLDLDQEVEKKTGVAVVDIFRKEGEKIFRELELETLQKLRLGTKAKGVTWVALGAGFPLEKIPASTAKFLWVRRVTDPFGRIFFDRPRLSNVMGSQLDEFRGLYNGRTARYSKWATQIYEMPEGVTRADAIEQEIFNGIRESEAPVISVKKTKKKTSVTAGDFVGGPIVTLERSLRLPTWPPGPLQAGGEAPLIEIRSDLINFSTSLPKISPKDLIYSYRHSDSLKPPPHQESKWDWAVELGEPPAKWGPPSILSLHERDKNLSKTLAQFAKKGKGGSHLKLAVEIHNFLELKKLLEWQQEDPDQRSVLPHSPTMEPALPARWAWVRLYLKGRQKMQFVSGGMASAADQPTIWQWLASPKKPERFAAVLGWPVFHSHSPAFHQEFFAQKGMPFWGIPLDKEEYKEGFALLEALGLQAAAVTAPLKALAGGNTLTLLSGKWKADNTDLIGLQAGLKKVWQAKDRVAVWGGGGTLSSLQELIPKADYFSQRTGKERNGGKSLPSPTSKGTEVPMYDLLIWAAGPEASAPVLAAKKVFDLNYREDSLAREFAVNHGLVYESGDRMFEAQAEAQQKIWAKLK